MKVIVAKTAGFCWGVRRAMDAVLEASARKKSRVQTLGPLIHNPQALDLLARRGVAVAEDPGQLQCGTVLIRAHGIPIQELRGLKVRQAKGELDIINATCPEVAKVHAKIKKWSPKGYFTVILGTHGHAESTAHQSYAQSGSAIVSSMIEAEALTDEQLRKVLVVAQTTFTTSAFYDITDYIRGRSSECIIEHTICKDTWTRQNEAREIAEKVDVVIIVGGRNSANTRHLAELADKAGKPCQFVETASELDLESFQDDTEVGVLAGASTPTWLVEEVVDKLEELGRGPRRWTRFLSAAFSTPLLLALGGAFMTWGVHNWMGSFLQWQYSLITGTYILAMYLLSPYLDPVGLGSKGPARARFLERNESILIGTASASLAAALITAATLGFRVLIVVFVASMLGLLYRRPLKVGRISFSLQSIPGSKDLLVPAALAVVAVAPPLWHQGRSWDARAWGAVLLVAALSFARTVTHGIRDMQNDQIMGRETLPILFGRRIAKILLMLFLGLALGVTSWLSFLRDGLMAWRQVLILLACTAYPVFHLWLYHERFTTGRSRFDMSEELSFFLAGLLAFVR